MTRAPLPAAASPVGLAHKLGIGLLGFGVLGLGVVMVVLPFPGVVFMHRGLVILETEFRWARRLLQPLRTLVERLGARARRRLGRRPLPAA